MGEGTEALLKAGAEVLRDEGTEALRVGIMSVPLF
jgi:hypothetical protein